MRKPPLMPVLHSVAANTYILSGIYLSVGLATELLRRFHPSGWALRLGFALDALPAQVLGLLGALHPLRDAYFTGSLSPVELRLVFSGTTLSVIFALALTLGALLALAQNASRRFFAKP